MHKSMSYLLLSSVLAFGTVAAYANHHEGAESEVKEMKADINNDGKVSYEEFKTAREKYMEQHFKRMDTNGDGFIDAAEKQAAKENMKKHHKACKRKMDTDAPAK
jgi:hemerythrin